MKLKISFSLITIGLWLYLKVVYPVPINFQDSQIIEFLLSESIVPLSIALQKIQDELSLLSTPDQNISFFLYTPFNQDEAYILKIDDVLNLNASPFSSERATKIIIHGWTDQGVSPWVENLRRNYFITGGDYNIISVNWYPLSLSEYSIAVKLTRSIGDHVGALLEFLHVQAGLSFDRVHVLGHSLGAHIAGIAAAKCSGIIGRITGMDPAGPLYEFPILKDSDARLDSSDAKFVDVIHTCGGTVGFSRAIGHVDFYPNGGSFTQPGCPEYQSQSCSHTRSYHFMIDSVIHPIGFVAVKCNNWDDYKSEKCSSNLKQIMGEYVDPIARGKYYLETNANSPFGQN